MVGGFEFLGEKAERVLELDSRMCSAAAVAVEKFLGERTDVPCLISEEVWAEHGSPMMFCIYMTLAYAHRAIGQRVLRQRPMIECLIQLVILDAVLGDIPVRVVLQEQQGRIKFTEGIRGNKLEGEPRYRSGIEMIHFCLKMSGGLPKSYSEIEEVHRLVKRKAISHLLGAMRAPKKTEEEKKRRAEEEAELVTQEIRLLRESWGIPAAEPGILEDPLFE